MQIRTTNSTATTARRRTRRTAVVAAGVCASVVMGVGGAVAAEAGTATDSLATGTTAAALAKSTEKQADAQEKAAKDKKAQAKKDKAAAKKKAEAKKKAAAKKARSWVSPVSPKAPKTASFGQMGPYWGPQGHSGQDYGVPEGTPVKAVHGGTVINAEAAGVYGNQVVIQHDDGHYSQYAHLSKFETYIGDRVETGEVIAKSGNTGTGSGAHLHFEIRNTPVWGDNVDPVKFLAGKGAKV